jgi:hypothetical protein
MSDDEPPPDEASEAKPVALTDDVPDLVNDARLVLANPGALIEAFRYLQQRIPGFIQLSAQEERSLIRVSSLDPEFIEAGLRAGSASSETKKIVGRSGEELRQEAEEIRNWDEFESEVRALLKGISAANRKRRHRLGTAILDLYNILGITIDTEGQRHLRPYYEEMKRAYKNRKRKREPSS